MSIALVFVIVTVASFLASVHERIAIPLLTLSLDIQSEHCVVERSADGMEVVTAVSQNFVIPYFFSFICTFTAVLHIAFIADTYGFILPISVERYALFSLFEPLIHGRVGALQVTVFSAPSALVFVNGFNISHSLEPTPLCHGDRLVCQHRPV